MIIYEDDEIITHFDGRGGDTIVISFAHMDFPTAGRRYWGSQPLEKLGLSAIGIVSKRNVWYPPSIMAPVLDSISNATALFQRVLIYGFSMGGYAALKYSKSLHADTVIALSPQASIDPDDDVGGVYRSFFIEPLHAKTGITSLDVSGNAYLFYDPYQEGDSWSARFVADAYPPIHLIKVPRAQHETIDLFASTQALEELFSYCAAGDISGLHSLVTKRRRLTWRRVEAVTGYAISRNRDFGWRLVSSNRDKVTDYIVGLLARRYGPSPFEP
ncbi:hypothetical protein [Ensifer sp. Root127]|uniref:hypothetical protein n=1 Tax=Ensifer sp. Root127 TaxID=1736440 RepID=UPI0007104BDA|nr:hypothetical protein [Ensifer sp. Root127]KQW61012.1 hypothetical protein ASD03_36725 [Ensifer sp. Root127]